MILVINIIITIMLVQINVTNTFQRLLDFNIQMDRAAKEHRQSALICVHEQKNK